MKKRGSVNLKEIKRKVFGNSDTIQGYSRTYFHAYTFHVYTFDEYVLEYTRSDKPLSTEEAKQMLEEVMSKIRKSDKDFIDAIKYLIDNAGNLQFLKIIDGSYRSNRVFVNAVGNVYIEITDENGSNMYFDTYLDAAKYLCENFDYINIQNSHGSDVIHDGKNNIYQI